jgi:Fic family protein
MFGFLISKIMTIFVMLYFVIMRFGEFLKQSRVEKGQTMQQLSALSGIDQALISKYESSKRFPSDKHLLCLASALDVPVHSLKKEWIADRILQLLGDYDDPLAVLTLAESRVEYLTSQKALQLQDVDEYTKDRLSELDDLHKDWTGKKPLNALQLSKLQEYFNVNYTFDSNRIEGNTLTLQETHLVVNEGITISGKSMKEHLEAINHMEAIGFIRDMVTGNEDITKRNVLDIHRLVLKSIDKENAGAYRKVGVRISGSQHMPPDALQVPELMDDFFRFYQEQKLKMHPVLLAAEMHERLVSIHPFIDGNGRTARLVMNFILLKNGYTLAILKGDAESRLEYYKALEDVQLNNDQRPFYNLIIRKVKDSLKEHLSMV